MSDPPGSGYQLLRDLTTRAKTLLSAHFQVADRCNHSCRHCYQVQGQKGELTLEEVDHVLTQLARGGVALLNISGGEATLRHDILEILRTARAKGFAIRFFTNAYAIDESLAKEIARIGLLEVNVSVYSDRPEEHDRITRVPGSHARTMRGIELLRGCGVRVRMKCPVLSLAPGAAKRLRLVAETLNCEISFDPTITPVEDGALETLSIAPSEEQLIADEVVEPWEPSGDTRDEALKSAPCGVCNGSVTVLPNGEVRPCTDTLVSLGNLATSEIEAVLSRPEVDLFRDLTWSKVHGCRDCDLVGACIRCHAAAAHEGGDYLGPYASGCSSARARYSAAVGPLDLLEPDVGCEPGRDRHVGPYRIEQRGVLRPIADRVDDEDRARIGQHPWIRPELGYARSMLGGRSDSVVALRRSRDGAPIVPPKPVDLVS